ncbi:hypothetical protein OIDMADRAFT_35822 [Oidiodendron maius Zn]|uniref:Uncharacterized protein n=1 Tax=Oidiodendron maius (strain Zn) TaxID=913774 RepID=A0A0C3CUD3_OIDMZ|nr:hypothetical protein OIDMADRAFT_35822 [Oidiodendron maius Zn]
MAQTTQLRVKTELRRDYVQTDEFRVPTDIMVNYPWFQTGTDENDNLTIFYTTWDDSVNPNHPDVIVLYRDPKSSAWVQESTNFTEPFNSWVPASVSQPKQEVKGVPRPNHAQPQGQGETPQNANLPIPSPLAFPQGFKILKHPTTGAIHVAYAWTDMTNNYIAYLDTGVRFPKWTAQNLAPLAPQGTISCLCLGVDLSGKLFITCTVVAGDSLNGTCQSWKWYPGNTEGQGPVRVPELEPPMFSEFPGFTSIHDISYEQYQDVAVQPDRSPVRGYYAHLVYNHSPYNSIVRCTEGSSKAERFTDFASCSTSPGSFQNLEAQIVPLGDPDASPLLFSFMTNYNPLSSSVAFIEDSIDTNAPSAANVSNIFKAEFMPTEIKNAVVMAVQAVVTTSSSKDINEPSDAAEDTFQVHVMCLFDVILTDKTRVEDGQLWHISSIPGKAVEVADGIYNIPEEGWNPPSLVTRDIYFAYGTDEEVYGMTTFGFTLVQNTPVCTVLKPDGQFDTFTFEAETSNWVEALVDRENAGSPSTPTALLPDGTIQPNLEARIGSDSRLWMEVNGKSVWIDGYTPYNTNLSVSGKLGVTVMANETLVPPSFWQVSFLRQATQNANDLSRVWVAGMEEDAKVDIQPSPKDMHDTFSGLGQPNQGLADIQLPDGTPLITDPSIRSNPDLLGHATTALQSISTVITGDATASTEDSQYIYHRSSLNVARARKGNARRLGKLQGRQNIAFLMDFRGGFTCKQLNEREVSEFHDSVQRLTGWGWIDDIGDFFEDAAQSVYDVGQVVVNAIGDTVSAVITFTFNGISYVWNCVLETASQIANIAVQVFNTIKVTFEQIVAWLGFLFSWGDFMQVAKKFEGFISNAGNAISILGLLNPSGGLDNDQGTKDFLDSMQSIISILLTEQAKQDAQAAAQALEDFVSTILSRGIFDATTFASLLNVCRAISKVALDIFQSFLQALIKLFKFTASKVSQLFTQEISIPGISWIWEQIMDEPMTIQSVYSLALAIPFTLMYKIITGKVPFANDVGMDPEDDAHIALGVMNFLYTLYNLYGDHQVDRIPGLDAVFSGILAGMAYFLPHLSPTAIEKLTSSDGSILPSLINYNIYSFTGIKYGCMLSKLLYRRLEHIPVFGAPPGESADKGFDLLEGVISAIVLIFSATLAGLLADDPDTTMAADVVCYVGEGHAAECEHPSQRSGRHHDTGEDSVEESTAAPLASSAFGLQVGCWHKFGFLNDRCGFQIVGPKN